MKQVLKSKFGWDVSDLTEYVNEESQDLLRKKVLTGTTLDLIAIQEGVKHKEKVKLFDVDVEWASGDTCGFTASGDAKFTDREIEVANIKLEKKFCNLDLLDKWTQKALAAGAINELEDFPYEQILMDTMLEKNAFELERAVWNSDATNGSGNLQFFDGFEVLFASESSNMIDINTGGATTFDATNAFDIIFAAYEDMSADDTGEAVLQDGAVVMLTGVQYNKLIKNILDDNLFHFDPAAAASEGSFVLPGTDLRCVRINGRTDSTKFYIGSPANMIFGTDLRGDTDQVKMWYNEDEEEIRLRIRFKAGTQMAFPEEMGYFELAAS